MDPIPRELREEGVHWLRIYWCDYGSTVRCHVMRKREVLDRLRQSPTLRETIAKDALALLPNDDPIAQVPEIGTYYLVPDWSSLRRGPLAGHVSCMGDFRVKPGAAELTLCPRSVLRNAIDTARALELHLSFEIDFAVMRRNPDASSRAHHIALQNDGHAWSTARGLSDWGGEGSFNSVLDEVGRRLENARINVEHLHVRPGPGQYTIRLAELPALDACDRYLLARQIIESAAAQHGFRVTLHPKPLPDFANNSVHVGISVSPNVAYGPFYAGILSHLRALTAFTYSSPVSYAGRADHHWKVLRWIGWGTENRAMPLRQCDEGRWEFRLLDGLQNPYLALAAILSAGTNGIARATRLAPWGDCEQDPTLLQEGERTGLGIRETVPNQLSQALAALEEDRDFRNLMPQDVVTRYMEVKRREIDILGAMTDEERRQWIIDRF